MLLFTLAAPLSLIDDDIIRGSPSTGSIQIKSLIKGPKTQRETNTVKLFDPLCISL